MRSSIRHICFWLALIICANPSIFAQEERELRQQIRTESADLEELYTVLDLAESSKKRNPRESLRYAQDALRLIQSYKSQNLLSDNGELFDPDALKKAQVDALILSGIAYKAQKRRARASRDLKEARKIATSISYRSGENRAKLVLTELEASSAINDFLDNTIAKVGEWVDGKSGPGDSTSESARRNLAEKSAAINEAAAKREEENGAYEKAIEFYEKSIKYHVALGDSAKSNALSLHVATLYEKLGETREADEILAITESAVKLEEKDSEKNSIEEYVEDFNAIFEATNTPSLSSEAEKETVMKRDIAINEAKKLESKGDIRGSRRKYAEANKLTSMILKYKSENQMDSLSDELFLERLMNERELLDQELSFERENLKREALVRNSLLLTIILLISLAGVSAWLFFTKRKSHNQISKAYKELEDTHQELKSTQTQLVAAEKMASLGQLTAGIAHEINNPVNFISGNIHPLKNDVSELLNLINIYEQTIQDKNLTQDFQQVQKARKALDFEYVKDEIKELLQGMEEGAARTTEIVKGLRMFARVDEEQPKPTDLHLGIDNTLALLKSQLKDVEIIKEYGIIPVIDGFPGKLNQVFMNVLTNAIQAMPKGGWIRIKTRQTGDKVEIRIQDTGTGIKPETISRIYEPFFTTKSLGEGTGLGLSISMGIVKQHGGNIEIQSDYGHGTEVIMTLPIDSHS